MAKERLFPDPRPRFYPEGYIAPYRAALLMAKVTNPRLWSKSAMSLIEWYTWHSEHAVYGQLYLNDWLRLAVQPSDTETSQRWSDVSKAMVSIRKALDAGRLVARFRHVNGAWDQVRRTSWAIDAASDVLWTGSVDLEGVEPGRLVLLEFDEIIKAFPELGSIETEKNVRDSVSTNSKPEQNNHTPPPIATAALAGRTARKKESTVAMAVAALWPNGIPKNLLAKTRNRSIHRWIEQNGHDTVSVTTIIRALRALSH